MQGKVVMQRSVLLVTEHSNTVIIVSVLAHDMSCWHHWSKVKEAIKRVEEEGLHHTNNVKEETERWVKVNCNKHHCLYFTMVNNAFRQLRLYTGESKVGKE